MAKKITELSELTTYATNDLLIIEDVSAGTTKKITWANLIADNSITAAKVDGIDKSLLTTDSNPYKFSVYRNAAANSGNNAYAKITFDTEVFDTNSNFATGTYTAPVAGFYQFNWSVSFSTGAADINAALYKNGAIHKWGGETLFITAGTAGYSSASVLVQSAANDTWEIYAYANTTTALRVGGAGENHFSGFLVSRT